VSLRQQDLIDRSLRLSDGVSASGISTEFSTTGKAGYYLRFNAAGTGFELAEGDINTSTFTQSGTGATERSVTSKLGEIISVKDFGATGDGVTDDTAAIQAAIDAVFTLYGGGRIWFPVGSYRISQVKLKTKVVLQGESWKSALLSVDANSQSSMVTTYDTSVTNAGIDTFFVNGNKANQSGNVDAIDLNNASVTGAHRNFVRNVFVYEAKRHGVLNRSQHASIQDSMIYGCDGNGLYGDNVHDCNVFDTRIFTTGDATVKLVGCVNWDFNNVRVWDAGQVTAANGHGFWQAPGTLDCANNRFTACDSQDNLASGWFLEEAFSSDISGIHGNNTEAAFKFKGGGRHRITGQADGSRIATVDLLKIDTTTPNFCTIDLMIGTGAFSGSMLNGTFAEDNLIRVRNNTAGDGSKVSHGYLDFSGTASAKPAIRFSGTYPAFALDFKDGTFAAGPIRFKGGNAIHMSFRNNAGDADVIAIRTNTNDEWQFDAPLRFNSQLRFNAVNMVFDATTGTKLGTATTQKLGFWNATPVVQQVLPTGSSTDNVISLLQTLGLCRQSA
jgi:hypothetical protein